jgi:hypothetical protein
MLRSFYQIGAGFYQNCAETTTAAAPSTEYAGGSEQRLQDSTLSREMNETSEADSRIELMKSSRRSSVRFSEVSSIRMLTVDEGEEEARSAISSSVSGQSNDVSADTSHNERMSRRQLKQGRRPMGYKNRRRRVHQLVMQDYASRCHRHMPVEAVVTILPDECRVLDACDSCSDISALSSDS